MADRQTAPRCQKHVFSGARHDFGGHRCTRRAIKDGHCSIHQPEYERQRAQETERRSKERWEAERRREALWAIPKLREMGYTVIEPGEVAGA